MDTGLTEYLDVCGEPCPIPLIRTEKAIQRMYAGQVLVVSTERAVAAKAVLEWCMKMEFPIKVQRGATGVWDLRIELTSAGLRKVQDSLR